MNIEIASTPEPERTEDVRREFGQFFVDHLGDFAKNEVVKIPKLGYFFLTTRKEFETVNPLTGEKTKIPATGNRLNFYWPGGSHQLGNEKTFLANMADQQIAIHEVNFSRVDELVDFIEASEHADKGFRKTTVRDREGDEVMSFGKGKQKFREVSADGELGEMVEEPYVAMVSGKVLKQRLKELPESELYYDSDVDEKFGTEITVLKKKVA